MAATIALGLAAALALGWGLWGRPPDRVAAALALLEHRCAPHVLMESPDVGGLVAVARPPRGQLWVAPQSRLAADPGGRDCQVTDALAPFDAEERARLAAEADALGLRLLPGSTATTPEGMEGWLVFRLIAAGLPRNAEAVMILSHTHESADPWTSQTNLSLLRQTAAGGG